MRKNIITILIILVTVILAGVAVYTAFRLYQLRQQPVAPNVPTSRPGAQEASPSPSPAVTNTCSLAITLGATATPTPTPTPTPAPECNDTCTTNADCPSDMTCSNGLCRHPDCVSESDCNCAVATATPTGEAPELPEAGVSTPTLIGAGFGALLLLAAFLLAI